MQDGEGEGMVGAEAIGELVTGGMAASAVEPKAGSAVQGGDDGHDHGGSCLNCGAQLLGPYCQSCGQPAHVHRSLGAFWHDLLHGVLHFEGKTWRTLPMLAWRPGELTRRYIAGERAKFVSPMALFLFGVFLMFAVFNSIGGPFVVNSLPQERIEEMQRANMRAQLLRTEVEALQQRRASLAAGSQQTVGIDVQLATLTRERQALQRTQGVAEPPGRKAVEFDLSDAKVETGWHWLDHGIQKWVKNPSLMMYKLQSNGYKFSWALIPLSVPFLALLFLWRPGQRRLYDHTVFVTYSISFVTLLLIVLSVARGAGLPEDGVLVVLSLIVPVHMFRQLKGAYELGVWGALWRTAALAVFAVAVFLLFLLLLFALGAF